MYIIRTIKNWFNLNYILPLNKRLGEVPSTKQAYKEYMEVAWPATMQGLFLQLMTAVDLAMVGALGADALAAVGIMSQPKMILQIFVRALAIALTAMIARRYGEGEFSAMNGVLKQGILITLIVYLPMLYLAATSIDWILVFAGAQNEYLSSASQYGMLITWSLLFSAFSQTIGAALIGIGHTKVIFKANAIGNVVNTVLNYFLIYGIGIFPKMGVVGAGVATIFSNIIIFVVMVAVILKREKDLSLFDDSPWRFKWTDIHVMGHLTSNALGEQIFERFGMFVYTKMVATLGVIPLATHHVSMNLCDIFYYFAIGLSQASASHTGRALGQNRPDMAEAFGKVGVRIGLFLSAIACAGYILVRHPFMELYTSDPAVIALGTQIIIIVAISSFPQTLQQVYSGVLKGAGDNYYVMKYSLGVIAIFRPIITYILCFTLAFGLYGAWLALLMDQSLRMIFSGKRFYNGKWKSINF